MLDLFHKYGAFDEGELKEFIDMYQKLGKHNWSETMHLEDSVDRRVEMMVNDAAKSMSNLSDRLALTIIDLYKRKLTQHAGDCTIYASLTNEAFESGICTCGYGLQVMRETGNSSELYSEELKETLASLEEGI